MNKSKGRKWAASFCCFLFLICITLIPCLAETPPTTESVESTDTGVDAQADSSISVPSVNTFQYTGAAVTRIPILVPPGRNGVAPRLSLAYNSYRKSGWLGIGWALGMGAIQRSTCHGVDYGGDEYVAVINGSTAELVRRTEDWGAHYYGAKIEGAFSRYYKSPSSGGWEVTTKDGMKYYYGTTPASRQDDPENGGRIFKWCLDRVEDTNGNTMTVEYQKDQGAIYLYRIDYTSHPDLPASNYVIFHTEDRPDAVAMFSTNFKVKTARRLKSIEIRTRNDLVRVYALEYTQSASTLRSLLKSVRQFGSDAAVDDAGNITGGHSLPAIVYDWQGDTSDVFSNAYSTTSGMEGYHLNTIRDRALAFDYNGDGRHDLFFYRPDSDKIGIVRSNGDCTFDGVYEGSAIGFAGYGLDSLRDRVFAFDYNADGRSDLFFYRPDSNLAGVARSNGDGSFTNVHYSSSGMAGYPITSERDAAFAFDYNGDGRQDLFFYRPDSDKIGIVRSNGDGTFDGVYEGSSVGFAGYKLNSLRDRVLAFDYNGDGRSDLFFYRPDSNLAGVASSNGDGSFTNVHYSSSGMAGYPITSERDAAFAFDYNGDGRQDLFFYRPDSDKIGIVRSNGDGTFDGVYEGSSVGFAGYKLNSLRDRVLAFDYNGDGRSDLFFYRPDSNLCGVARSNGDGSFTNVYHSGSGIAGYDITSQRDMAFAFDYNGNGRGDLFLFRPDSDTATVVRSGWMVADLLNRIANGRGAETFLEYADSSQYPNGLLPFIVHPVSRISVDDGLGHNFVVQYGYGGGLFDYTSREFRGFATVAKTNPDGTTLTSWFHQDEFFKGRQYRVESREYAGGPLINTVDFDWQKSASGAQATFVALQSKVSRIFENNQPAVETQEDYTYYPATGFLQTTTSRVIYGAAGQSVTTAYEYRNYGDWIWRKIRQELINGDGLTIRETRFDHDNGTGNLLSKEFVLDTGQNPVIQMRYDDYGNLKELHDANGNPPIVTQYDAATRCYPVRVTNSLGHVAEYEYDYRFGKVAAHKDVNGNWTYYDYDVFGRLAEVDQPDGGRQTFTYRDDVVPQYMIASIKENEAGDTIDSYAFWDGLGRKVQTLHFGEQGKPIVTKIRYDEMGRAAQRMGPFFGDYVGYYDDSQIPADIPCSKTVYDLRGRPKTVETALGTDALPATKALTTFSYSRLSTTVTDADGARKTETRDYLGRIVEVIEYNDLEQFRTTYEYSAAGDLLQVVDNDGNTTTISYDSLGRKISMDDPDMGYWQYTYDANGNLKTQTDAKGQVITFGYDALNRVVSKIYSTADAPVHYFYDEPSIANGIGRLYRQENTAAATTVEAYDPLGRILRASRTISGAPHNSYVSESRYDVSGKLTAMVYPDGYQVNYSYHPGSGLLKDVVGITDFTEYAQLEDYDAAGRVGYIYYGDGTAATYDYDSKSTRLLAIKALDPQLATINDRRYQYSAAGDIIKIIESQASKTTTRYYAYDKLHRLVSESGTDTYEYLQPAILGSTYGGRAPSHAVESVNLYGTDYAYEYDANGNMIRGWDFSDPSQVAQRTITYNADNMPTRIERQSNGQSRQVDFVYDGNSVRVKKQVAGGSTRFYIGAHFEVADGVEIKYIFAGSLRIARITGSRQLFFHKDHLGSTVAMTDYAEGAVVEAAGYLPFGLTRGQSQTEVSYYKFTDQQLDAEIGLYNYNARLYDPAIGIFITPDTLVQDPFDPQTLNRYSYVRNNPLIYTDPSGNFSWVPVIVGAVIGAAIGGTTAAITDNDVGIGVLTGAIGGALFGIAGELIQGLDIGSEVLRAVVHAGAGGTAGGINAAITDNDIGLGIVVGGLAAGVANYAGEYIPAFGNKDADYAAQLAGRSLIGGVVGGATAEIYGGKFGQGFAYGAATAAFGFLFNEVVHTALENYKNKQQALMENAKEALSALSNTELIALEDGRSFTFYKSNPISDFFIRNRVSFIINNYPLFSAGTDLMAVGFTYFEYAPSAGLGAIPLLFVGTLKMGGGAYIMYKTSELRIEPLF